MKKITNFVIEIFRTKSLQKHGWIDREKIHRLLILSTLGKNGKNNC